MTLDPEMSQLIAKIGSSAVVIDDKPAENGNPACKRCGGPIDGDPKLVQPAYGGDPVPFHQACWAAHREEQARRHEERRKNELEQKVADFDKRFRYYMAGHTEAVRGHGVCHPPEWPFARFDNEQFRSRASKKIVGAVEKWDPNVIPTLLLCSLTGRGKTAAPVAWLWRYRDQQVERIRAGDEKVWCTSFIFATGPEFAVARRNADLGEEAPLIKHSLDCGILIMDELGFEKQTEVPFEIIDHRYRKQAVTVVTTGLKASEFRARYGDAMYRRLTEGGAVVEDFPGG